RPRHPVRAAPPHRRADAAPHTQQLRPPAAPRPRPRPPRFVRRRLASGPRPSPPLPARGGVLMIAHHSGIHCIHIFGWYTQSWCWVCHQQLMQFHTTAPDPRARFKEICDADLARTVLEHIERGEIPPPPGYGLPEPVLSLVERTGPSSN